MRIIFNQQAYSNIEFSSGNYFHKLNKYSPKKADTPNKNVKHTCK